MASGDPLAALQSGTFALEIGPTAAVSLGSSKRRSDGDVVALRYTFKPTSITPQTAGSLEPSGSGRILAFDAPGGSQVFDVREEASKTRECVIVWNEAKQSFVLHALPATYVLTQNRTLSASRTAGGAAAESEEEEPERPLSNKRGKKKAAPAVAEEAPPAPRGRASVASKNIARKQLPAGVAAVTPSTSPAKAKKKAAPKTKAKAAPKAAAKKKGAAAAAKAAAAQPASKIKSVEIIEDSDDEPDPTSAVDDDMDEFADMLGAAVEQAGSNEYGGDAYDDEDDEDDVEEDEDDELGGAHFAGHQPSSSRAADGDVEWI